MEQITGKQLEDLRQIAIRLLDWVDNASNKPVEVPPEIQQLVEERVAQRICLACGQKALEGERISRGQDSACYATTRSRIRRGLVTERQLIEQGKMTAEAAPSGRPARQDLSDKELKVAELAERYNNRKKKAKE